MKFAICVTTILVIMIILTIYIENNHQNQKETNIVNKSEIDVLKMCQVPTLSMEDCFKNEYNKCPKYNGSYDQCTNNYIPEPSKKNCPCKNRAFKISEKCYNQHMNNVIHKNNDINVDKENPRVNMWQGDIKNDKFFIQCS
jgi:hypothetical protein